MQYLSLIPPSMIAQKNEPPPPPPQSSFFVPLENYLNRDLVRLCINYLPEFQALTIWKAANLWQEALLLANSYAAKKLESRVKAEEMSKAEQADLWEKLYTFLQGSEATWKQREIGMIQKPIHSMELLSERQICCSEKESKDRCLQPSEKDGETSWIFQIDEAQKPIKVPSVEQSDITRHSGQIISVGKSLFLKSFNTAEKTTNLFKIHTSFKIKASFSNGSIAVNRENDKDPYKVYIGHPEEWEKSKKELIGTPSLPCLGIKEYPFGGIVAAFMQFDRSPIYLYWKDIDTTPQKLIALSDGNFNSLRGIFIPLNGLEDKDHFEVLSDGRIFADDSLRGSRISDHSFSFEQNICSYPHPICYTALNDARYLRGYERVAYLVCNEKTFPHFLGWVPTRATAFLNLKDGRFASCNTKLSICIWEPDLDEAFAKCKEEIFRKKSLFQKFQKMISNTKGIRNRRK